MKVIFSTLFGLILSYLIYKPIVKTHGPNSNDIKKYIYYDKKKDKYYKYLTDIVICPSYLR